MPQKLDYIRVSLNDSEIDESLADSRDADEVCLQNLLKKHVKRKRRKALLLAVEPDTADPQNDLGDFRRMLKARGRGRPGRGEGGGAGPAEDGEAYRRHQLWVSIMKKEVSKGGKARNYNAKEKVAASKRLAAACMRAQRQRAMTSQRTMKEAVWRAKRLTREMQSHWRKQEREEKQQKKAKEKIATEQRKLDIEILEAKRQQRKLNFLITQTELYAHFMAGKLGVSTQETENSILSRLNTDVTEERVRQLDDYDEAEVKARARKVAAGAAARQEAATTSFSSAAGAELSMSEAAETAGDRPQPSIFHGQLKSYQLKGMNWLCSLYDQGINGILADEMGLGKTVQALSFLAYVAETYRVWGPFLVVTPASTLHNWQQEVARFVPQFKCVPYWGTPQERKVLRGFWSQESLHTREASFHIVVTSYQIVITDYKYFTRHPWQYLVLDEAQAIKSANSQRWKMLLDFKCRGRLLLSGTPIQNTMAELWSLLHFVMPALFDSHDEFKEWFSKDIEGHAEGTKGKVDEKQMSRLHLILKPFMLRRIKKDVEHELTEKVEVLLYCPLTIRQRHLYTGLKQNLRLEELLAGLGLDTAKSGVSSLMNLVMQFRKVCNHPELFERREPRSALLFSLPGPELPRLPLLDPPNRPGEGKQFSVFRADRVHSSLQCDTRSPFSLTRFLTLSPGELEQQHCSLYWRWKAVCSAMARRQMAARYQWCREANRPGLLLPSLSLPASLTFTSHTSTFLSHLPVTISRVAETISHRQIRSRGLHTSQPGLVTLLPEFPHTHRQDQSRCGTRLQM